MRHAAREGGRLSTASPVRATINWRRLGPSFNGMTENLERLNVIEKEQERLKSRLHGARVQASLFPRSASGTADARAAGVCPSARMVSGDYYDFVATPRRDVGLAIATWRARAFQRRC